MASLLRAIFACLPIGNVKGGVHISANAAKYQPISEKDALQFSEYGSTTLRLQRSDEAASSIVSAMLNADKPGPSLDATIRSLVSQAGGWSEYLATKILEALETVLKAGTEMNPAMQEAYDKACDAAKVIEGFAADHPVATAVFCTIIALGVLVVLAPYVLEFLGFSELGPIEGKPCFPCRSR